MTDLAIKHTILIVEDDLAIREMLNMALARGGYDVIDAEDADAALAILETTIPSLILLDWMLPTLSGIQFVKKLHKKKSTRDIPIIMVSAKSEEDDKLKAFANEVDDYITKPFSVPELLARIKSVIRRSGKITEKLPSVLKSDELSIDLESRQVLVDEKEIPLGPTEFKLLQFFMQHPNRVYNRAQLLDFVWGAQVFVEERTVDVHIRRLRRALEPYELEKRIKTVRGSGYRFIDKSKKATS